jgi:hypothetical protein
MPGPTMLDYIETVRNTPYFPPNKPDDQWDRQDIFFAAMNETLKGKYQLKATILICDMFSPLKLFFKQQMKSYINTMNERRPHIENL